MRAWRIGVIASACVIGACKGEPAKSKAPEPGKGKETATGDKACDLPDLDAHLAAPRRLVAIGDLHGDAGAARAALRLAGAIDDRDRWIGGDLVVVQLGDVLDRGDGEEDILDLFARLEPDARAAGGALVPLDGNHELMNAAGDFRYVTPGGFATFGGERGRLAALGPGGRDALREAAHRVVAIVGDTVFVHGGLEPAWASRATIDDTNRAARCWLAGQGPPPAVLDAQDGPVWSRTFAGDTVDCDALGRALAAAGATRMVVAHTVQPHGISSACDGRVWRIDVGLAKLYGGPTQALEITHDDHGDHVRVLDAAAP